MELVVLAAGRGSRFIADGVVCPKPIVSFMGKPLFWWAVESALSSGVIGSVHFCILNEHVVTYHIDEIIRSYYPTAHLHVINEVTRGAAETSAVMAARIKDELPMAFLDCDLAFGFGPDVEVLSQITPNNYAAVLCTFKSHNPAYSYVRLDSNGVVLGAVEKKVVSNDAIAGMYAFPSGRLFLDYYTKYAMSCHYEELYTSGLIDLIAADGGKVGLVTVWPHISLGTPKDLLEVSTDSISLLSWLHS